MPIGTGIIYNVGDLILSQVSGSGTAFLETKIAAATSSIVYFDNTARINSASLNSITVGTASYVSGSTSIITNLTASNISASGTSSFGYVGIGTSSPSTKLHVRLDNAGETTLALFENRLTDFASAAAGQIVVGARGYNHTVLRQNPDLGTTPSIGGSLDTVLANTCALGSGFGKLILATQSTASLIIDYSGNVGIGTASPTRKLDVNGDVNIGTNLVVVSGIYNAYYYAGNSTATYFKNSVGNDTLTILQGGNVGIGTTSPNSKLHIVGGPSTQLKVEGGEADLWLISQNIGATWRILGSLGNTTKLFRIYDQDNALDRFNINSSGSVGIGTTSPTNKLSVGVGSPATLGSGDDGLRITDGTRNVQLSRLGSTYSYAGVAGSGSMLYSYDKLNIVADTSNPIIFNTGGSERMRILSDGNVGIGTSSPNYLTDIQSTTSPLTLNLKLNKTSTTNDYAEIAFQLWSGAGSGANTFGGVGTSRPSVVLRALNENGSSAAGAFIVGTFTGGSDNSTLSERFRITSTGNVGIGTTSATTKLHVSGSVTALDGRFISNVTSGTDKYFLDCYGTSTNQIFALYENSNTAYLNSYSSMAFRANQNGGSGGYFVFTGANVGIGTTSPTNGTLQVYNASGNTLSLQKAAGGAALAMGSDTTNYALIESINAGGIRFYTGNGTQTERLRIDVSGSVGIGTTSPANKLHVIVAGGLYNASITNQSQLTGSVIIQADNSGANSRASLIMRGSDTIGGAISVAREDTSPTWRTYMAFYTNNVTSVNVTDIQEKMRLNADGNLGIGTTVPAYLLDVSGSSRHGYRAADTHQFTGSVSLTGGLFATNITASNISASRYTGSSAYFSNIGFTDQTVASDTSTFPTGSTSDGLILDGGVYTNGVYRTRFVKVDRGANLSLYIQETKGSSGSFSNLARFGTHTNSPNTFEVFGSTNIQGSITSSNFVGSHIGNTIGTASWASNALTASFLPVGTYNITSSWAQNVVSASYALTSSFATTAQTANALNASNTYTIAGLTSAYVDVNGSSAPTTGIYRPSTKTLGLSADGTLIFKISNVSAPATSSIETGNFVVQSGNFGLGTNSPNNKLDIFGGTGTTLNMSNVDDGSRGGKLTFISSSATGRQFYVGTNSSIYNLVFGIDSIEKMRLDTSGYFAINTTNTTPYSSLFPGQLVVDAGTSNVDGIFSSTNNTNAAELILTKKNPTNNFGSLLIQHSGSSGDAIALNYNVNTSTGAGGTNSFKVTTDGTGYFRGNVGIGTTSPIAKLHVSWGTDAQSVKMLGAGGSTNGNFIYSLASDWSDSFGLNVFATNHVTTARTNNLVRIHSNETSNGSLPLRVTVQGTIATPTYEALAVNYLGNVGIGTTAPAAKLEISGSSNSVLLNIKSPISGAILYVSGSGAVGIGTSNVGAYTLQVSGSFAATTKSFVIEHPTKAGKKLIYGSLESPYHGIRLTGRDTLVNGKSKIQLPDYIYKLILHDSINIQLTGIKCNKTLYVDDINIPENYFTIAYDKAIFESYKDYDFFWDFTAIRADVPELTTEL